MLRSADTMGQFWTTEQLYLPDFGKSAYWYIETRNYVVASKNFAREVHILRQNLSKATALLVDRDRQFLPKSKMMALFYVFIKGTAL